MSNATFEQAEAHVWDVLNRMGISGDASDTATLENMLDSGFTLARVMQAGQAGVAPYVIWL